MVNWISGSTHSYLNVGSEPFGKNGLGPNPVLVPAVFLAGALFFLKSLSLFIKNVFLYRKGPTPGASLGCGPAVPNQRRSMEFGTKPIENSANQTNQATKQTNKQTDRHTDRHTD